MEEYFLKKSRFPIIPMIFIICLAVFVFFLVSINSSITARIDQLGFSFVSEYISASMTDFFKTMTMFGSGKILGIATLLMALWLWLIRKDYVGIVVFVFTVVSGDYLNVFIKNVIARPRPHLKHLVEASGFSFPSGHAMMSMIVYSLIAYFIIQKVTNRMMRGIVIFAFAFFIFLIGFSRVILHVHYPSDVVSGYSLGFVWSYFAIVVYKRFSRQQEISNNKL